MSWVTRRGSYVSIALGILIPLVMFGLVFPQAASYQQALDQVRDFSPGWLVALVLAAVLNLLLYPAPTLVCLPGLTYGQGFVARQSAYAMSNLTPVGGALAVGTQFSVLSRYGVRSSAAAAVVSADAVWAYLLTLGLPTLAVLLLIVSGQGGTSYAWLAGVGAAAVVVSVIVLMLILRTDRGAERLGRLVEHALHRFYARVGRHEPPVAQLLMAFRSDARDLVARRWRALTLTNTIAETTPLLVLFCALGGLGVSPSPVTVLEAFAAYSLAIALNALPVTPGGLGLTDGALVGLLVAFGADASAALAADLVWRLAWFVPQMTVGTAVLAGHLLTRHHGDSGTSHTSGPSAT